MRLFKKYSVFIFSVFLSLLGIYITRAYIMDDALITLRYSYNFAHYGTPFWNQADVVAPSMGYTSILWMGLNAIPALLIDEKERLVMVMKVFALISFLPIVFSFATEIKRLKIHRSYQYLVALLIFSQIGFGFHVNSGMETILFSTFVLFSVHSYVNGHYRGAYLFAYLSFLARPEGAILVAALVVFDLFAKRSRQAFLGSFFFVVLVVFFASLLFFWYGTFIPNPFYIKQGGWVNLASLKYTFLFVLSIALPFSALAFYAVFFLKDRKVRYIFAVAIFYLLYYISVAPLMNVFFRYQWVVVVLLIYASMPAMEFWLVKTPSPKWLILAFLTPLLLINMGSGFVATYFADSTGYAMNNLMLIGKKMNEHRTPEHWLVYHDAGAVSYFSDWNTFETIGLTNRAIARGDIDVDDFYANEKASIILQNFDLNSSDGVSKQERFEKIVAGYGFEHFSDIPILFVKDQRNFVVAVYARDVSFATDVFSGLILNQELEPNFSFSLYRFAKEVLKGS